MCYSFISAYANLSNSSCHFSKHKSVFLQSSVPSNITFLYFFSSNIIYSGQRSQLKSKFFRFSSVWVKICQIPNVKWQVNSSSNFASFFIVTRLNSPVNFKLIHFLLWTKASHQNLNFDIFKCSDENLPNFSYHFSNHNSAFFFKFCITLQCHERKLVCTVLAQTLL